MTPASRGLDLSNMTDISSEERAEWDGFYARTIGHAHIGLDFWMENGPETLKRYRLYSDCATPKQYESSNKIYAFAFVPYYALIGYDVGVRYLLYTRQRMGMTREQILEALPALRGMGPEPVFADRRAADRSTSPPGQQATAPRAPAPR